MTTYKLQAGFMAASGNMRQLVADDERLNRPGPFRKFYLTKQYGEMLRQRGYTNQQLHAMDCAALEAAIMKALDDFSDNPPA
jgi:hypothetical protein